MLFSPTLHSSLPHFIQVSAQTSSLLGSLSHHSICNAPPALSCLHPSIFFFLSLAETRTPKILVVSHPKKLGERERSPFNLLPFIFLHSTCHYLEVSCLFVYWLPPLLDIRCRGQGLGLNFFHSCTSEHGRTCGSEVLSTSLMIRWPTDRGDLINECLQFSNPKEAADWAPSFLHGSSFQTIMLGLNLVFPLFWDCEKILSTQDLPSLIPAATRRAERPLHQKQRHYSGNLSV